VVGVTAGPAAASPTGPDTASPMAATNCSSATGTHRIGTTTKLETAGGHYYGWAEWRQGTTGKCAGREWVAVHVTRAMRAWSGNGCMFGVTIARVGDSSFKTFKDWYHSAMSKGLAVDVAKGTYRTLGLYSPHNTLHAWPCRDAGGGLSNLHHLFFGHGYKHYTWYD
jgi:hypothetical protein